MRKASILLATAGLLATACTTATGHLAGGTGSAGSVTLLRLQPQAEHQAQPSPAPTVRISPTPGGWPAPQSRVAQPSVSAAPGAGPTDSSLPSPALPPTDRCLGSPNPNLHQPEPMCAVP